MNGLGDQRQNTSASTADTGVPSEPMTAMLGTLAIRVAGVFRVLWAATAIITVSVSWVLDDFPSQGLAVAVMAVGWAGLVGWITFHNRRLPQWIVFTDSALFALMLAASTMLVPTSMVGDGTSWVFTGATVSLLLAGWLLRFLGSLATTAAMVIAYFVGVSLAGVPLIAAAYLQTALLLLAQGLLAQRTLATMRTSGRQADQALASVVTAESAARMEKARGREAERQERLLHDQVAGTLWLIGDGHLTGTARAARARCTDSLTALRALALGRLLTVDPISMTETIEGAVNRATSDYQLNIALNFRSDHSARNIRNLNEISEFPADVKGAISEALRQALANVKRHAQTKDATVDVWIGPQRASVVVTDTGVGFFHGEIDPAGRGLSQICNCMTEVGGSARIASTPGTGTTIHLSWIGGRVLTHHPDVGGAALRSYGGGFLRMIAILGLTFHFLSLFALIGLRDAYRHPDLVLACWFVMLVGGVLLAVGFPWMTSGLARFIGSTILLASAIVVSDCHTDAIVGFANWAFGDTVWAVAFAAAYLRAREVLGGLLLVDLTHVFMIIIAVGDDPQSISKLAGILLGSVVIQVGIAVAFTYLRKSTEATSQNAWQASVLAADRLAAIEARRERARRAEQLDRTIVELLTGVACGHVDPDSQSTQAAFKSASIALRNAGSLNNARAGARDLVELATAAAIRGTDVEIMNAEKLDSVPSDPRSDIVILISEVLQHAEPGVARLTVQNGADLTVIDWQTARPHGVPNATTVTLSCMMPTGRATILRDELDAVVSYQGRHFSFDLVVDEPEDAEMDVTSSNERMQACIWLAIAYRP